MCMFQSLISPVLFFSFTVTHNPLKAAKRMFHRPLLVFAVPDLFQRPAAVTEGRIGHGKGARGAAGEGQGGKR